MTARIMHFTRRGSFWASASVLALCLWASGAPSVLYPSYAAQWHLNSTVVTSIFATYPAVLLVVLLVFGSVSDTIGRRRTMLIGVALIIVSAVVFAIAPDVGWVFVGRALQGAGAGFAIGAASASLVENNVSENPRLASSVTTASTALGLTLVLVVSGLLAQYAPLPQQLSFVVLAVLSVVVLMAVWSMPETKRPGAPRWHVQAIRVPKSLRRTFVASTLAVSLAYSVGAVFLSLGASIARDLTGTTNLLVVGALLGVSSLMIGAVALVFQRIHAHIAVLIGVTLSIIGLVLLEVCASSGSLPLFLLWCVIGGAGYSLCFMGGLMLLNRSTSAGHRGATLSALYLFAYLLQALTAVGAGVLATALSLSGAVDIVAPVLGALALATGTVTTIEWVARRRGTTPVAEPVTTGL
ncbi:MFS transporter [Subtercola frigoramans]|uniref:MFS family permease n=1 Tax=Subtercola frigoramans TaxID=120298 RepID=A0ABS2L2M0_9MICO|nr:MFS transporter [Subtercola frigoramans]MBM7471330.1 MFS family permease [Subtercola frigoramans]